MARTLIGELLLRIKADTREAKSVSDALKNIEAHSKSLANAPWGAGMQRTLEKLKATPREIDLVRRSWDELTRSMANNGLDKTMRKNNISAWRQATVSHLAAVRREMNRSSEAAKAFRSRMDDLKKMGLLALGGYTGAYVAQAGTREALTAASRERAVEAEAKFAGLSEGDRGKIGKRANELAVRYNLNRGDVLDMLKDSSLAMPNTDTAISMSDAQARAMISWQNLFGKEGALDGLRRFNKAMDNLNVQDPEEYTHILDTVMRAQQVIGKDVDPESIAQAVKYSRASGKIFSKDFMFNWLPLLAAETGGSDAGTATRAMYDQFIGGKATKKALAEQERLGLRKDGQLTDATGFVQNPYTWAYNNIGKILKDQGVDSETDEGKAKIAQLVSSIASNRLAADFITRALYGYKQTERAATERMPKAYGLDAADTLQQENPFAGFAAFKDAVSNLAAAVMPMETISSGLNKMANGINAFQQKLRDGDALAWGAVGAGGVAVGAGALGVGAVITSWMTAGPALNGAAAALEAAAISLGSKGGVGEVASDTAKKAAAGGGLWAIIKAGAKSAGVGGALTGATEMLTSSPGSTFDEQVRIQGERKEGLKRDLKRYFGWMVGDEEAQAANTKGIVAAHTGATVTPEVDSEKAIYQAQIAADDIRNALNVTVGPNVDLSGLDALQSKLLACVASLGQLRAGIPATVSDLSSQLNRSFSDHQLTP